MITLKMNAKKPSVDEVLRYMRAGRDPEAEVIESARCATDKIFLVANSRACYEKCSVELLENGKIRLGALDIFSKSLENRLFGCTEAYIFAVTVGSEVDRIIRLESAKSSLSGLSADAAGSAMVESAADELNFKIDDIVKCEGKRTKTRFSAGYGDFSIEYQRDICALLETKKNIGVALGAGGMMTPTKSVTAIIGVY